MEKVIVITGGSDGLGRELAKEFAKENKVVILSPTEDKLKSVANLVNCDYVVCDVTDYHSVENAVTEMIKEYTKIDVLINNAGVWIQEELERNDSERIKQVIEVNLLGTINMTKAVISNMKANKDGLVININSQAGINYKAERTVYNASKWGVTGFTKSLQPELAKYGIRVTDVYPGMLKTNMFQKLGIEKNMNNGLELQEVSRLVKFIVDTPKNVMIPEVGIKNINN